MADTKDTIYIDIDDDISAIIDKVTNSASQIVALVLPKRATALKSQVNMKLLKRAADEAKKNLVLVTSESALLPLAGAAEIYVASTPTSKPEIPPSVAIEEPIESIDEDEPDSTADFDSKASGQKSLGELAGLGAAATAASASDDEPIELDNSEAAIPAANPKAKKPKKNKKLAIPNFNRFRKLAVLAALVIVGLAVLAYFAFAVWPHATISIYTKESSLPVNFTMSLNSNANSVDTTDSVIPATVQTIQKNYSQTVPATGQKDEGTPATGSVAMSATKCGGNPFIPPPDVPSGTGVNTNNLTYITQSDTSFSLNGASPSGNNCYTYPAANNTSITAQNPGTNYNVSNGTFTVSGRQDVSASGSASGGTSNVVQVVQQSDIDKANQQLASQNASSVKQQLILQLQKLSLTPMSQTFGQTTSNQNSSASAGTQASNVTVTETVTYLMYGYKRSDFEQLIKAYVANQTSLTNQGILDYGISGAVIKLNGQPSTSSASVAVSLNVTIGPKLNIAKVKAQAAGKKAGEVQSQLTGINGVTNVKVHLSPFWVGSVPKDTSKITVKFIKSNG